MSRSLGKNYQRKQALKAAAPEAQGFNACMAGLTISACPYFGPGGKQQAWIRGFNRARMQKQKEAK